MHDQADAQAARLARATSRSVMIATPVYHDTAWQYTRSLVETCLLLQSLGIKSTIRFIVGNSNLPKARNELAAEFLATGYSDMVFIDSDMGWSGNDVVRLLASDKDLIGGVGRKRVQKPNGDPEVWCARFDPAQAADLRQDDMGAVEVLGVGTGFLKIGRPVFEAMIAAHPDWKRPGGPQMSAAVNDAYYQFFRFDPDCTHGTGEDYAFCAEWRALGGSVWIDPGITLTHVGSFEYTGCIAEILTAA